MKPVYCTETMERIPPEYFAQGKAVWCDGRPYILAVAKRLGLRPDAAPPDDYLNADPLMDSLPRISVPVEAKRLPVLYCSDTFDRLPFEFFAQGKAVWSGGKPYLRAAADRLRLKLDPGPPPEIVSLFSAPAVPPPAVPEPKPEVPAKPEPPTKVEAPRPPELPKAVAPIPVPLPAPEPPAVPPAPAPISPVSPVAAETEDPDGPELPLEKAFAPMPGATMLSPAIFNGSGLPPTDPMIVKPTPEELAAALATSTTGRMIFRPSKEEMAASPLAKKPEPPPAPIVEVPPPVTPPPTTVEPAAPPPPVEAASEPPTAPTIPLKLATTVVTPPESKAATPSPEETVKQPPKELKPPAPKSPDETIKEPPKAIGPKPPAPPTEKLSGPPPGLEIVAPKPAAEKPAPAKPVAEKPAPAKPAADKPAAAAAAAKPGDKPDAKPAAPKEPKIAAHLENGTPLEVDEIAKLAIFEGIPKAQIERLYGTVVLRQFKKGEIVCAEGDYGSTAFYILSGSANVYINAPIKHVKSDKMEGSRGGVFGIFRRFKHTLAGSKEAPREGGRDYIPFDGPMDLPFANPIATLKVKDLFGEMSCMSNQPRSATVCAAEDSTMLEMLRNVLQVLQKNKKFKEQLDKAYRERALGQHLRSVSILRGIDEKFVDQLRNRVELVNFEPGETIVTQGADADAFYLIRVGCVKVSQKHPGGDLVLTYLGRGEYFGEMGLLKGGKRTATCTALDHVEVVRIKKVDFDFMLGWYEDLRPKFEAEAEKREKQAALLARKSPNVSLDAFLAHGLMHAQSLLLLDLERCTRCDECVRACADSHEGVTRLVREGLRFDKYLIPTSCRSCMDPVCMIGCPVGSIRRKESLEIIIEDWCIGCKKCAQQCPYGNITMHPFEVKGNSDSGKGGTPADKVIAVKAEVKLKAVTCDLCTDLNEPSCVYACPHDAAIRVNAREFFLGQNMDDR